MTSRETLALLAVGLPAVTALGVIIVPRRAVQAVALAGLAGSGAAAIALAVVALADPAALEVSDWVVIDAAAGLMVGVIGIVGLASALASPAFLATTTSGLFGSVRCEADRPGGVAAQQPGGVERRLRVAGEDEEAHRLSA